MGAEIISFFLGGLFVGVLSWYFSQMVLRAEVIDMINEQTHEHIKDLEFDNNFLKKQLIILNDKHKKTLDENNKFLKEFNDKLKGL